jgi:beta-1,4-N-acetylglucosaminyltransferase
MPKTVFVTVGTTEFDQLISVISSPESLRVLRSLGYQRLVLQIGRGKFEPESGVREGIQVTVYRYKSSIKEDITSSDLIISHAGSGTCLEVLEANRRLL